MKRKTQSKPREFTISSAELTKFGMGVMNKDLIVDFAKAIMQVAEMSDKTTQYLMKTF